MGGRLDAVNVIDPTAALITNVDLDHCEWLGEDVETIAFEKAGIMRPGIPVVYGGMEVPDAIRQHADAVGARLLLRGRDFTLDGVPQPGLPGDFQVGNAAAVIALLRAAGLEAATGDDLVARVLPEVRLTARCQRVEQDGVEWLLDVAHNPAAASQLGTVLAASPSAGETVAVIGMLDDKDVEGVITPLDPYVDRWIALTAGSHRSIPAGELARRIANASDRPCQVAASLDDALAAAREGLSGRDRVLVTGSFYVVGPVMQALGLYSRPDS
jgi:dihydrofolate synthase/folylpolyglutamate synthase